MNTLVYEQRVGGLVCISHGSGEIGMYSTVDTVDRYLYMHLPTYSTYSQ